MFETLEKQYTLALPVLCLLLGLSLWGGKPGLAMVTNPGVDDYVLL